MPSTDNQTADAVWKPQVTADLDTISNQAFVQKLKDFELWSSTAPAEPVPESIQNGWCVITPEIAEKLLRRNKHNRRPSLSVVRKYARRMQAGEWRLTGQPGIMMDGDVYDMQHRLYACYFGNVEFTTYMVTDVPMQEDLFAYLDDMKSRTIPETLFTGGANGIASTLATAVKLAWRYQNGALGVTKAPAIRAMDNKEALNFTRANKELGFACHEMLNNHAHAVSIIGNKGLAGFVAWEITMLHGPEKMDEFMRMLGMGASSTDIDQGLVDPANPVLALRTRLKKNQEEEEELPVLHVLALIIKGFNMFLSDQTVGRRGLFLRDNEEFPLFEDAVEEDTIPRAAE